MERYDLYDRQRNRLGRTALRGEAPPAGTFRLVIHVALFHPDGRLLIQQRQQDTHRWHGLWDLSAGGGVVAGETSWQAAQRETMEELGLSLDLSGERPALSVSFPRGFDDIYLVEYPVDLAALTLQKEEVQAVRWAGQEEIHAMIAAGTFIPYHGGLIDLLFGMQRVPGSHQSRMGR